MDPQHTQAGVWKMQIHSVFLLGLWSLNTNSQARFTWIRYVTILKRLCQLYDTTKLFVEDNWMPTSMHRCGCVSIKVVEEVLHHFRISRQWTKCDCDCCGWQVVLFAFGPLFWASHLLFSPRVRDPKSCLPSLVYLLKARALHSKALKILFSFFHRLYFLCLTKHW